jgi:hypothetical protein
MNSGRYSGRVPETDEVRFAENEALFRTLNENILRIASELGDDTPYEFTCECSTSSCLERLSLTLGQYELVRQNGSHFLVVPGHENSEVESVVAVGDGYLVVEKFGIAGVVARAEDPRD